MLKIAAKLTGLTASRMVGAVAAFVTTVLITREFGPDVLAAFAICLSAAGILSVTMPLGMQSLAPVQVAKAIAANEGNAVRSFIRTGRKTIGTVTLVAGFLVMHWALLMPGVEWQTKCAAIITTLIIAPQLALLQFHGGILNGFQQQFRGQLPDTFLKPVLFLLLTAIIMVATGSKSLLWILLGLSGALMVATFIQLRSLAGSLSRLPADQQAPSVQSNSFKKTGPWLITSLLWDYHIEVLMLVSALFVEPIEVAILHICFRIRVLCGFGVKSIYAVFQPKIYTAFAKQSPANVASAIANINRFSVAYAAIVMLALWGFGSLVLSVFDQQMGDNVAILLLISSVMVIRTIFGPAISLLAANDRQAQIAIILIGGLVVSLVGCTVLYPLFGIAGIAAAYAGSCLLSAMAMWAGVKRELGVDTAIWHRPKRLFQPLSLARS